MRSGLVAVLIAAGVSVLVFLGSQWAEPTPSGAEARVPRASDAGALDPSRLSPFGDMPWSNGSVTPRPASSTGWWLGAGGPIRDEIASPLSTVEAPSFSADPRGNLALNAQTHASIERLLLSGSPQAVQAQLAAVSRDLPGTATQELQDLVTRFQKYTTALTQSIPPGNSIATEQEALKQLEQLHNLRVSYFGEDTARALYAGEEAMTRHILAMAEMEKDPSLTLQQKAERAQESLSKLPAPLPRR